MSHLQLQEVAVVEEFVYLGSLFSMTQISPDITCCNAESCSCAESSQSYILFTISTKLKVYNACILSIFLYGSECWAVIKRDVLMLLINGVCEWWCERDNQATATFGYFPSTTSPVQPHCANAKWNRCQDLNSFPLENWRRPPGRPQIHYVDENYPEIQWPVPDWSNCCSSESSTH